MLFTLFYVAPSTRAWIATHRGAWAEEHARALFFFVFFAALSLVSVGVPVLLNFAHPQTVASELWLALLSMAILDVAIALLHDAYIKGTNEIEVQIFVGAAVAAVSAILAVIVVFVLVYEWELFLAIGEAVLMHKNKLQDVQNVLASRWANETIVIPQELHRVTNRALMYMVGFLLNTLLAETVLTIFAVGAVVLGVHTIPFRRREEKTS